MRILDNPTEIAFCRPHQLAWLRRPELDQQGQHVWERPDGTLFAADPARGEPIIAILKNPLARMLADARKDTTDKG